MFSLETAARNLPGGEPAIPGVPHLAGFNYDPEWREVHRYSGRGDGHEVIVSVARMPAMFWRIQCPGLGIDLATGSDMHELAGQIAEAIAEGMLGNGDDSK